jgi:Leucine-rich repeat (LRR) protein
MTDKEFNELCRWADENNLPEYVLQNKEATVPDPILPRDKNILLNMEDLDLSDWGLNDIHPFIGKLTNLKELNLWRNKFKEIPEELCDLSNLEVLHMSYCKIKSLPQNFGNLKNLKELWLNNTAYLNKFPDSFFELENLEMLNMVDKNLKKLSEDLGNLKNLKILRLYSCGLRTLPNSIGDLTNLEELSISPISQLPENIVNLKNLKELSLNRNTTKTDKLEEWLIFLLNNGCEVETGGNLYIEEDWINTLIHDIKR